MMATDHTTDSTLEGALINHLPDNVVFDILLRLPVRSLLRFRCVCKEWCALIKSSLFKDTHLAFRHSSAGRSDGFIVFRQSFHPNGNRKGSVTNCDGDYESLALSVSAASSDEFEIPGNFVGRISIINHVNGIVCVMGDDSYHIALLNPSLREFRILPVLQFGFNYHFRTLGFGYDDATDEYKVVGIVIEALDQGPYHINRHHRNRRRITVVYRLSTNSWTNLGEVPAFVSDRIYRFCIFFHGSVHWLMTGNDDDDDDADNDDDADDYRILTFNMTNELFQEIQFPLGWEEDYDYDSTCPYLYTVERSTIALVAYNMNPSRGYNYKIPASLDVWVMKEYGVRESWTKQYSIEALPQIERPLFLWGRVKLFIQGAHENLICYDLSKGEKYQPLHQRVYLSGVYIVTGNESFVSIK